jgi:hypothetical protein
MSVDFYWDNTGLAKNAAMAIEILTGQRSSFIRDSFAGLLGGSAPAVAGSARGRGLSDDGHDR